MPKITNTFEDLVNKYRSKNKPEVARFLSSLGRRSPRTALAYSHGLDHLDRFIALEYPEYGNVQSILQPLEQNKINIYKLLDKFVDYLQNDSINGHDLSALSVKAYVTGARSYFCFNGIDVIPTKFKYMVKMPTITHEKEAAIDEQDIRKIVLACNNRRLKAYLLCLASSGARATEMLAVRWRDFDNDNDFSIEPNVGVPVKVNLRAEYTKTGNGRPIYISDEAAKYVKVWKDFKYRDRHAENKNMTNKVYDKNDLVFETTKSRDPRGMYFKLLLEFQKVLDVAGLNDRKDKGVNHRRKITFHSFRRFVKTTLSKQVGYEYSEGFLGHDIGPYFNMTDEDKRKTYAERCMKYLRYLDYATLEATGKDIEAKLYEKDKQIQMLQERDTMNRDAMAALADKVTNVMLEVERLKNKTQHSFEKLKENANNYNDR